MKATSIHSREQLVKYFEKQPPQLECDYVINIYDSRREGNLMNSTPTMVVLTGFTMPDIGLHFETDDFGHVKGSYKFNSLDLQYVITSESGSDAIYDIVSNQFINGVPKFIPFSDLPNVEICRIASGDFVPVMSLNHCRFSYPRPNVNLSGNGVAVYSTTVTFEDYIIE